LLTLAYLFNLSSRKLNKKTFFYNFLQGIMSLDEITTNRQPLEPEKH